MNFFYLERERELKAACLVSRIRWRSKTETVRRNCCCRFCYSGAVGLSSDVSGPSPHQHSCGIPTPEEINVLRHIYRRRAEALRWHGLVLLKHILRGGGGGGANTKKKNREPSQTRYGRAIREHRAVAFRLSPGEGIWHFILRGGLSQRTPRFSHLHVHSNIIQIYYSNNSNDT